MSLLYRFRVFAGRHNLISALERIIELLKNSEDSDWSNLSASELADVLNKELTKIKKNQEFDKFELAVFFAPTGSIQEIAMKNSWHNEYLKISPVIDKHT